MVCIHLIAYMYMYISYTGQELGDTTTLADPEVVHELIANHVFNK